MKNNKRLDIYLVENNYSETREKAKALIMSGIVYVDGQKCDKSGTFVSEESKVEVRGNDMPYVSRGGLKLEKALIEFNIDLEDKIAMDIGASTGGFSDCMLQRGAKKIFAVDVGYGQLAWKIRTDPRVTCMERVNIRYINPDDIPDKLDFATIDVSFISLKLVLPSVKKLLSENGEIVCLIKPQFEAGREKVGKNGVVRDLETHKEVLDSFLDYIKTSELYLKALTFSPIKGPKGNIEYLAYLTQDNSVSDIDVNDIALKSHNELKG